MPPVYAAGIVAKRPANTDAKHHRCPRPERYLKSSDGEGWISVSQHPSYIAVHIRLVLWTAQPLRVWSFIQTRADGA